MTPEHTDRDLRERIAKLRDRIRCISATTCLMDIAKLFAQVADDLDAALTASEGPRVCPTCGSDDPAKNWCVIYGDDVYIGGWGDEAFVQGSARIALGTVTAYRCPDSTAFHGIEASEGGEPSPTTDWNGGAEWVRTEGQDHVPETAPITPLAGSVPDSEVRELLREALDEYADHQSWRCGHPDRYPLDEVDPPDCPCGLHQFSIRARRALAPDSEGGTDG